MTGNNERESKGNGGVGIAWVGVVIVGIGNRIPWDYWLIISIIGLALAVAGGVLWAQRKNRHWAFGLFGVLAPIGFLGVSLLKNRSGISTK